MRTFFDKALGCAKPMPLLPPVMTAIFPASFCPLFCSYVFSFLFSLFFYVEFTLFLQSSHSHRLLLLLEQILEDELPDDRANSCRWIYFFCHSTALP